MFGDIDLGLEPLVDDFALLILQIISPGCLEDEEDDFSRDPLLLCD